MKPYTKEIPLEEKVIQQIITSIENAEYLYKEYIMEENFPTDNGREGSRWNYINKEVKNNLSADRFHIEVMCRGIWKFIGIFDRSTGYLYTLMRNSNLKNLRNTANSNLFHYTNALSVLNEGLKHEYSVADEQLSLFPELMYDESAEESLQQILEKLTANIDGHIVQYALIAFDVSGGHVNSIKGVVPAVGMNYYKEENWSDLIGIQYDDLSRKSSIESLGTMIEICEMPNLKRKSTGEETSKSV